MKKLGLFLCALLLAVPVFAQTQAISASGQFTCCAVAGSLTTTQQTALTTAQAPTGAFIFNSTLNRHSFWDGTAWQQFVKLSGDAVAGNLTATGYLGAGLIPQLTVGTVIASATTIAPTTPVVHISGTTAVVNITAPAQCLVTNQGCLLILIPDGIYTTTAAGNIALASTAVVSKAMIMTYDNGTSKWYPSY